MKKNTLLLCCGMSGSGKSYFIKNTLPSGLFYNLKSATTRKMRDGESEGKPYYFRDEKYFDKTPMATHLFVNEQFWKTGEQKWLYGVPESEVYEHVGQNLTYDVIQPKYARELIDWFCNKKLNYVYDFKVAWFLPPAHHMDIVSERANMENDIAVRKNNTCTAYDLLDAGLWVDYMLCPLARQFDVRLIKYIQSLIITQNIK